MLFFLFGIFTLAAGLLLLVFRFRRRTAAVAASPHGGDGANGFPEAGEDQARKAPPLQQSLTAITMALSPAVRFAGGKMRRVLDAAAPVSRPAAAFFYRTGSRLKAAALKIHQTILIPMGHALGRIGVFLSPGIRVLGIGWRFASAFLSLVGEALAALARRVFLFFARVFARGLVYIGDFFLWAWSGLRHRTEITTNLRAHVTSFLRRRRNGDNPPPEQ